MDMYFIVALCFLIGIAGTLLFQFALWLIDQFSDRRKK